MPRYRMNPPPETSFTQVYEAIKALPDQRIDGLTTTGGIPFSASAALTRDGREYIHLPHNNRIYQADWGFTNNHMGMEG